LLAVAALRRRGADPGQLYARLERRRATHLVILIASLGTLAVMQNIIAAVFTPNILQFPMPWASANVVRGAVSVRLTWAQVADRRGQPGRLCRGDVVRALHHPGQAHARRGIESVPGGDHPAAAAIRLCYVVAIGSAIVALPGVLVPLDLGLQPYGGITPLLTATIAMIAGGVGSITGAFVLSIAIAELQNLSLLVMPGEWSIGITFFIFVIFMLFRPTGLFAAGTARGGR
jgi:branched-chain amino acid transport system permease protein